MIEHDPGHSYELMHLDGCDWSVLRFVKRVGPNYPGNTFGQEGTNIQEVLRCLIARHQYVNGQKKCWINPVCIFLYRVALNLLEYRAARINGRRFRPTLRIERLPFNPSDGHIRF